MKSEERQSAQQRRLPRYYRVLRTLLQEGIFRCSSSLIAERTGYSPSAVRADLNLFDDCAKQGYGYQLSKLYPAIGAYLGVNDRFCAVLLADGAMRDLLCSLSIFRVHGIRLIGVFSSESLCRESQSEPVTLADRTQLVPFCQTHHPTLVISALPLTECELKGCADAGVLGIWNLCEEELHTDLDLEIMQAHPLDSLMQLCCTLNLKQNGVATVPNEMEAVKDE